MCTSGENHVGELSGKNSWSVAEKKRKKRLRGTGFDPLLYKLYDYKRSHAVHSTTRSSRRVRITLVCSVSQTQRSVNMAKTKALSTTN